MSRIRRKIMVSRMKKIFNYILYFVIVLFGIMSTFFMICSYKAFNFEKTVILVDISIIVVAPIFIMIVFKRIFNFKGNNYIDNLKQVILRYVYVIIIFLYTKLALEVFRLKNVSIDNVLFARSWMCFMLIGSFFFLRDIKRDEVNNSFANINFLKKIIINNKDSLNLYSFLMKNIPIILYNICLLYFCTIMLNNSYSILKKVDANFDITVMRMVGIVLLNDIPVKIIKIIQFILPISSVIYSLLFVIVSFINDRSNTFEKKLYRIFVLILGIIFSFAIAYTYVFIVDNSTFIDLKFDFELSALTIVKLISNFCYFSLVVFTSTGYGDITPTSELSQLIVLIEMIAQIITITISLGIFFNWKNNNNEKEERYESAFTKVTMQVWKIISKIFKSKTEHFQNIGTFLIVIVIEVVLFAIIYTLKSDWFYVKSNSKNLITFFYFSITNLSTVGFGDIYPIRLYGKFLVSIQMLIQMGLILFGINIINNNSNRKNIENSYDIVLIKKVKCNFVLVEFENKKQINLPIQLLPEKLIEGEYIKINIEKEEK